MTDEARDKFAYIKALRGRADLTPAEYRLLVTLWSYTDGDCRHAYPGAGHLARDVAVTDPRNVKRTLKSLLTKGYLMQTRVGGKVGMSRALAASVYDLALPATGGVPELEMTL